MRAPPSGTPVVGVRRPVAAGHAEPRQHELLVGARRLVAAERGQVDRDADDVAAGVAGAQPDDLAVVVDEGLALLDLVGRRSRARRTWWMRVPSGRLVVAARRRDRAGLVVAGHPDLVAGLQRHRAAGGVGRGAVPLLRPTTATPASLSMPSRLAVMRRPSGSRAASAVEPVTAAIVVTSVAWSTTTAWLRRSPLRDGGHQGQPGGRLGLGGRRGEAAARAAAERSGRRRSRALAGRGERSERKRIETPVAATRSRPATRPARRPRRPAASTPGRRGESVRGRGAARPRPELGRMAPHAVLGREWGADRLGVVVAPVAPIHGGPR